MTTNYPMKCRYDRQGHGDFANGIMLRRHYDEMHPEYVAPASRSHTASVPWAVTTSGRRDRQQISCDGCGSEMLYGSFAKHRTNRHGGSATFTIIHQQSVAVVPHVEASRPAEVHVVPDAVDLEPMGVDDIVLPAITALAMPGSVVPVSSLAALFLWRDQTAAMLSSISGKV